MPRATLGVTLIGLKALFLSLSPSLSHTHSYTHTLRQTTTHKHELSPRATPVLPSAIRDYRCCGDGACSSRPGESVCVNIVARMPILLGGLAEAAGQGPNKRLLWCLHRLPVQNTVVLQRPLESRDGSVLKGLRKRMAFIKLLRGEAWL